MPHKDQRCDQRPLALGCWTGFWVGLAASLSLLSVGGPVAAAKSDSHAAKRGRGSGLSDRATQLREQGAAALARKDWAAASDALIESYRLSPEGKTLYLLGQLAWSTGKTVAAQDLMRRFLADPASAEDPAAKAEADKIADQPRPASGDVLVVGERGSLVSVDDRVVGMLPLPLPLLIGSGDHKLTLEVNGRRLEGPVRVLPGRTSELRFNLSSDAVVARVVPAVVWVPEWKGVPGEAQKLLSKAVEQSVAKQKLSVVSKGMALVQAPRSAECLDQLPCLEQLATVNEAGYALTTSVEATGDLLRGDWAMKLALIDAPTGDYAATVEKRCERCTADQASAMMEEAATALLQKGAARPRGTMEVLSDPPGADVLLVDRRLGQTPYVRTAFVGSYDVTLKLAGYAPVRQHVEVTDGKKATVRSALVSENKPPAPPPPPVVAEVKPVPAVPVPPPAPATTRERRPIWRIATGASLLGVGVILGAYGISGLSLDGQCAPSPEGCSRRYDTIGPGAAFLSIGIAAAAGGVVLLAIPGRQRTASATRLLSGAAWTTETTY